MRRSFTILARCIPSLPSLQPQQFLHFNLLQSPRRHLPKTTIAAVTTWSQTRFPVQISPESARADYSRNATVSRNFTQSSLNISDLVRVAKLGDASAQLELGRRLLEPSESKEETMVRELMDRSLIDLSGRPTGGASSARDVIQEVKAQLKRPQRKRKRKRKVGSKEPPEVEVGAEMDMDMEMEVDDGAAEEWLRKAALAGRLEAYVELGMLFIRVVNERGEELDIEQKSQCIQEAIRCFMHVLDHGDRKAEPKRASVNRDYEERDRNRTEDEDEGFGWSGVLQRYEAKHETMDGLEVTGEALFQLGILSYEGVEGLLTADSSKALEYIAEAAAYCRDPAAMFWIGHVGLSDEHPDFGDQYRFIPGHKQAFAFVKEAADAGHTAAQVYVFKFLCSLEGEEATEGGEATIEEDLRALGLAETNTAEMAMTYLGRAVEALEPEALYLQADLLLGQDNPRALALYIGAGSGGIAQAWVNAGAMFYEGLGTEQDYIKAFLAYEKGALLGSAGAWTNIASMYFNGEAVVQCKNTARKLLQMLPDQGQDPTLTVPLESVLKLRAICEQSNSAE